MKKLALGLITILSLLPFVACNSTEEYTEVLPSSALVRSFSLSADKYVAPNLDSVFFSIDLYSGRIFNADSLPYGASISRLVPVIVTDGASAVELIVPRENNIDTVYNYIEHPADTIDFSRGPVRIHVVSLDGKTERNYSVTVNVHQVPTDTLRWSRIDGTSLPSLFRVVTAQHTAVTPDGRFFCYTYYDGNYSMAWGTNPAAGYNVIAMNPGFDANINSLTATNEALYILDKAGNMYTSAISAAGPEAWQPTGKTMHALIGAYGNRLLATVQSGSTWQITEYPAGTTATAPAGFPVSGSSNPVSFRFDMGSTPQMIVVGGRRADGTLTGDTWGFDGTNWANLTRRALPYKLENMALTPYFNIIPDTISWRVAKRTSVMLAMFGNDVNGMPNDTVYMSRDFGMHWDKAPDNLQIDTKVVASRTLTQVYPFTVTAEAPKGARQLQWTVLGYGEGSARARIAQLDTTWDVPYLYMFGGVNAQGTTYNTLFRGVITAFTFRPLQ